VLWVKKLGPGNYNCRELQSSDTKIIINKYNISYISYCMCRKSSEFTHTLRLCV